MTDPPIVAEQPVKPKESSKPEKPAKKKEKPVKAEKPEKEKKEKSISGGRKLALRFLNVFIVLLLLLISYQLYQLLQYYNDLRSNDDTARLAASVLQNAENNAMQTVVTPAPDANDPTHSEDKPPVEPQILPAIQALREEFQNDDIVGYISINGTNIHYPVVQTTDNEFYIKNDLAKLRNVAGTIFMDCANNPSITDYNTVLYGHNMKNGSMLHNLRYYNDRQFFTEHRFITYRSLYEETVWEVFSFYPTETDFNYINTDFITPEHFTAFVEEIQLRSVVNTNVDISSINQVLTLSTCTNTADNMRFALHARRLSPQ